MGRVPDFRIREQREVIKNAQEALRDTEGVEKKQWERSDAVSKYLEYYSGIMKSFVRRVANKGLKRELLKFCEESLIDGLRIIDLSKCESPTGYIYRLLLRGNNRAAAFHYGALGLKVGLSRRYRKLELMISNFADRNGRNPDLEEIESLVREDSFLGNYWEFKRTPLHKHLGRMRSFKTSPLDVALFDSDGFDEGNNFRDRKLSVERRFVGGLVDEFESFEETEREEVITSCIRKGFERLTPEQRIVIASRYGLHDLIENEGEREIVDEILKEKPTFRIIATYLPLSVGRVEQIEKEAFKKLYHPCLKCRNI